jgi:hypothetical protein
MDIKKYKRLLEAEFDYLAVHHLQRGKILQEVQDLFDDHLRRGLQADVFFTNLGSPRIFVKSLKHKKTTSSAKE